MIIVFSFNDPRGRFNFIWQEFSLDAWLDPFGVPEIGDALVTSVQIAALSTLIAVILGTLTALALVRYEFRGRGPVNLFIFIPLATPEVVLGAALLSQFLNLGTPQLGFATILIAHIMFNLSFVVITVRSRLIGFDRSLEEAAQDLGATPWETFRLVTLPLIMPGVAAAALLAFALSIDDFVITSFNSGSTITFPLFVWGAAAGGGPAADLRDRDDASSWPTLAAMTRDGVAAATGRADGRHAPRGGPGLSLDELRARERERFGESHGRSARLHEQARSSLLAGVPMSWMAMWAGGFPMYLERAHGATLVDADGNEYADFCLGDTGAMAGHSPEPTMRALAGIEGITTMLPTEDAAWVGDELARRFGVPLWQFALTATDANRWMLRMCRHVTGRPRVAVFNWCYHGSVDEAFVTRDESGRERARDGLVGPAVDPAATTRVAEFNDVDSVEAVLAHGDVACLLMEPALTNIGIVLPEPGFLEAVRELCTRHGTLLIIDETHTFSAGPGGCTAAWGLEPDAVTLGKSIGGGVPIGAYGVSAELAERIATAEDADLEDTGGVGGTLAGSALSLAAARATLGEVLTDAAFVRMIGLRERFVAGAEAALAEHGTPWSIVSLGARCEYRFTPEPPRTGAESAAAGDPALDEFLHLYLLNRGVLITPFHNMALMCPATTEEQVDRHTQVFADAVAELAAA